MRAAIRQNDQTSAYIYDDDEGDHRLLTIHHQYPNASTLSKFDYTYDAVGNILTWQQQADSDPAVLWRYEDDAADQLTAAVKESTGGSPTDAARELWKFPKAMWKSLRTTHTVENLNLEFRRRTKTQASFGTEDAALTVLYGLVAFGHVQLRKVDGHQQLASFLAKEWQKVA